jgi:hypothetical protein
MALAAFLTLYFGLRELVDVIGSIGPRDRFRSSRPTRDLRNEHRRGVPRRVDEAGGGMDGRRSPQRGAQLACGTAAAVWSAMTRPARVYSGVESAKKKGPEPFRASSLVGEEVR